MPGSGVNLNKFYFSKNDSSNQADKYFKFIFVGRLIASKGIYEYIKAARILLQKDLDVKFYVAGGFDNSKSSVAPEQLKLWEVEGVIRYLGFSEDIRETLLMADCIVHPSYSEGLPRVLLESAAMGRPIISTNIPGSNSIVVDGYSGYLVQPKNAEDLASKMEKMYRLDELERRRFGRNGREIVVARFSEELVLQEYLIVLNRLLGQSFSALTRLD